MSNRKFWTNEMPERCDDCELSCLLGFDGDEHTYFCTLDYAEKDTNTGKIISYDYTIDNCPLHDIAEKDAEIKRLKAELRSLQGLTRADCEAALDALKRSKVLERALELACRQFLSILESEYFGTDFDRNEQLRQESSKDYFLNQAEKELEGKF